MRVAVVSSFVPFVKGGARNIVDWLVIELTRAGHDVEVINLPFSDDPAALMDQLAAYRWVHIEGADRVICLRPPSHLIRHEHKVLWFIHHLRFYYDLWDTPYRGMPDDAWHRSLRTSLIGIDTRALEKSAHIFTNSEVVSERLRAFNDIDSEVLYPPILEPESYRSGPYGDEVLYVSRVEHHKRQHLAVQAMRYVRTDVKLRIAGAGGNQDYVAELAREVERHGLQDRVTLQTEWIDEDHKRDLFAESLAVAYLPFLEDSYGYPTLEAFHSERPVVTTSDSGGVLEIVEHEKTGLVAAPSAASLANAFDRLHQDRDLSRRLGTTGRDRLGTLNITWSHVIEKLLS